MKNSGKKFGSVGVLIGVMAFQGIAVRAEVDPISGINSPQVGTQIPPAFSTASYMGMANMFSQCMIQDFAGLGRGGGCGSTDIPAVPNSCSDVSPDRLDDWNLKVTNVKDALKCKSGELDKIVTELNCLQTQQKALEGQIASMQQMFVSNISRMEQDYKLIESVEKDREMQLNDVQQRLNGGAASGKMGLRELLERSRTMVNEGIPNSVKGLNDAIKALDVKKKQFEEGVQVRKIELTNECFSAKTNSSYRCTPNGPPVSAKEYVLCRFEQNQLVGANGVVEENNLITQQAASRRAALQSILDGIESDSAKAPNPNDPASANKAQLIRSVDDIDRLYGSKLTGFDGKGLNIRDFVITQLRSCFSRAETAVSKERQTASSFAGFTIESLKNEERTIQSEASKALELYSQQFNDNVSGLTGMHLPVNAANCKGGTPTVQIACLEDLKKNMEGMVNGTTPQSSMVLAFNATSPATAVSVRCQGLSGCVTALETLSTGLEREHARVKSFREGYALKSKQSVEKFASDMGTMMSPMSQQLQARIQKINQMLQKLGVPGISTTPIEGEALQVDDRGLPVAPNNVLALIGSKMNPPMPGTDGDAFKQGADGLRDKRQDLAEVGKDLKDALQGFKEKQGQCKGDAVGKAEKEYESATQALLNCANNMDWCDKGGRDQIARLGNELGSDFDIQNTLTWGADLCKQKPASGATATTTVVLTGQQPVSNCHSVSGALKTKYKNLVKTSEQWDPDSDKAD